MLQEIVTAGAAGAVAINLYLIVSLVWVLHVTTVRALWQWDAANLLGVAAFRASGAVELVGISLHVAVSLAWAAAFALLLERNQAVARQSIAAGAVFGVVVWAVMQFVVVPLGRAPVPRLTMPGVVNGLIAHAIFFGIPVALICV
ncbi:MAG: hypothetical protein JWO85_3422, partial [Candidatus Eremiobacteraeota bacterium]|nr:hypothetical protein [Candidatus Eremiobacteraeota bacterium]